MSGIVFLIGPLILIDAAKAEDAAYREDDDDLLLSHLVPHVLPTSIPSLTITVALIAQCVAAPLLASFADQHGMRRILLAVHVVLGLACTAALGLAQQSTPLVVQALLLAAVYYTMALAWMFQNALLPSVAPVSRRPALSLASTALSSLGGAAFLLVQYQVLNPGGTLFSPLTSLWSSEVDAASESARGGRASAVIAAAASHAPPSASALHLVCLLSAGWWLISSVPSLALLSLLKAEPAPPELSPNATSSSAVEDESGRAAGGGRSALSYAADTEDEEEGDDDDDAGAQDTARGEEERQQQEKAAAAVSFSSSSAAAATAATALSPQPGGWMRRRRVGRTRSSLLSGVRRLRRHKHAFRFVIAQVLYLTAATADGTSASAFAQEVLGLDVGTIIRLTIYAALAGAVGSLSTMALARCIGAQPTLCLLMTLPPLLLAYSSLILETEEEFLIVGIIHAFVSGGVGFHGLNRGVFAQMVPRGREAEFFGTYFVLIKAFSWLGPLACALINEYTGSLRKAVLSALVFYIPAAAILWFTDFEEAKREAEAASHTPRAGPPAPDDGAAPGSKPHDRLLLDAPPASYGGV